MLSTFLFQQELGHSHNLNKVKPDSHSGNNSVSNAWDSLTIFWSPQGCDRLTFLVLPHIVQAAFLLAWALLYFRDIVILAGHPMGTPTMLSYPAPAGLHLHQEPVLGSLHKLRPCHMVPSLQFFLFSLQFWSFQSNLSCSFNNGLYWPLTMPQLFSVTLWILKTSSN